MGISVLTFGATLRKRTNCFHNLSLLLYFLVPMHLWVDVLAARQWQTRNRWWDMEKFVMSPMISEMKLCWTCRTKEKPLVRFASMILFFATH